MCALFKMQVGKNAKVAGAKILSAGTSGVIDTAVFTDDTNAILCFDYDVEAKREFIKCAISGTNISFITRGLDGTTACDHEIGANVTMTLTPTHYAAVADVADSISGISTNVSELQKGWTNFGQNLTRQSATTIGGTGFLTNNEVGDKIKLCQLRNQAYTNDPAAGSNITLNMVSTAQFNVGNYVLVSSSAGQEVAIITVVNTNVSIVVDVLALNHTTTTPLVYIGKTVTGDKYFYVTNVAGTLLTITGGTDYTLENAAIANPYYSKASSPVGFPANSDTFSPIGVNRAQVTAPQISITTTTDLTGLSMPVSVPTGKRIRITGYIIAQTDTSNNEIILSVQEGATVLGVSVVTVGAVARYQTMLVLVTISPTPGNHTYKLTLARGGGSGTVYTFASASMPASIFAELV